MSRRDLNPRRSSVLVHRLLVAGVELGHLGGAAAAEMSGGRITARARSGTRTVDEENEVAEHSRSGLDLRLVLGDARLDELLHQRGRKRIVRGEADRALAGVVVLNSFSCARITAGLMT